jgi:hypothetical protein
VAVASLCSGTAHSQVDSTRQPQELERAAAPFVEPGKIGKKSGAEILGRNDGLDTLLEQYPYLKRLVLHDLLVESYRLPASASLEQSISAQLQQAASLAPFEAASLAARHQQEIRGPTPPATMGQLNMLGLLEWLRDLFK